MEADKAELLLMMDADDDDEGEEVEQEEEEAEGEDEEDEAAHAAAMPRAKKRRTHKMANGTTRVAMSTLAGNTLATAAAGGN